MLMLTPSCDLALPASGPFAQSPELGFRLRAEPRDLLACLSDRVLEAEGFTGVLCGCTLLEFSRLNPELAGCLGNEIAALVAREIDLDVQICSRAHEDEAHHVGACCLALERCGLVHHAGMLRGYVGGEGDFGVVGRVGSEGHLDCLPFDPFCTGIPRGLQVRKNTDKDDFCCGRTPHVKEIGQ